MEGHSADGNLPEDYAREAEDVLKALRKCEITRARSMSPSHIRPRLKRRTGILPEVKSPLDQTSGPRHLEDLPRLELEGAPPGWGSGGRSRNSLSNSSNNSMPLANRRNSTFPSAATLITLDVSRPPASGGRRASQMTFDEWCQLKKLQEIHNSSAKERRQSPSELEHIKNMKKSISYDEWSRVAGERQKREALEIKQLKIKEEKEKETMDMAKYRRRMSFDQWREVKKTTEERQRKLSDPKPAKVETDEERRKKSEEAHRKWVIKKELEQLKKDRENMLRRTSVTAVELPTN